MQDNLSIRKERLGQRKSFDRGMRRESSPKRRGATTVEFAIAAPLLFLLLLAVFEFGWQVVIRHTADNAAYEASRAAIVPGGTREDALNEANRIMQIVGARSFDVQVNPAVLTEKTAEVEVVIRGEYANNGLIAAKFFEGFSFESRSKQLTERPRSE